MSYFLVSFVTLVVLGLTFLARSRYGPSSRFLCGGSSISWPCGALWR